MNRDISVRRYLPSDIDASYEAVLESRREISPWMPWCTEAYSRDDAARWVEARPEAFYGNVAWEFLIVDRDDNLLGACGIHRIDLLQGVGEIGYWVRTSQAGRGVATVATQRLIDWAIREKAMRRFEIIIAVDNHASRRVVEKLGAVQEGVLRRRVIVHGQAQDCALYALLAEEFDIASAQ